MRMEWEREAWSRYSLSFVAVWKYVDRDSDEPMWALISVYDKEHTRKDSYRYGVMVTRAGGPVRWFKTLVGARRYVEREHIKYLFD